VGVALLPIGAAQGVLTPMGAVGDPGALVGCGAGVWHGAAGFERASAANRPVCGRATGNCGVAVDVATSGATVDAGAAPDGITVAVGTDTVAVDVAAAKTALEGVLHAVAVGAGVGPPLCEPVGRPPGPPQVPPTTSVRRT